MIALIGLTISAVFLWLAFQGLQPATVLESLRAANPLWIIVAAAWYFTAVIVISIRWRFLLRPAWAGESRRAEVGNATPAPVSMTPPDPAVSTITDAPSDTPVVVTTEVPIDSAVPTAPEVRIDTPVTDAPAALIAPPTVKTPSIPHLAGLVSVGYMGNNVFPLRAGEILRIALVQSDFHIPFARVTTTVLVERILDGIVMLTFILAALLFGGFSLADNARPIAFFTAPLFLIALGVFFWFALHPARLRAFGAGIIARLPDRFEGRLLHLLDDAITGLEALRTPRDLAGAVVFSYASWMLEAVTYLIVATAFALPIDYWAMLLVVGVVNLAGLIPASPGQFGVYELFASSVLIAIGIAEPSAVAYAFSVHMVIWLPVTLVGFFILWRRGVGWNLLRRARDLESQLAQQTDKGTR
jgi:uncharacterized protein (TIRG00374 family)